MGDIGAVDYFFFSVEIFFADFDLLLETADVPRGQTSQQLENAFVVLNEPVI